MNYKQLGLVCSTKGAILYVFVITMFLTSCTNSSQQGGSNMEGQQSVVSPPSTSLTISTSVPSDIMDPNLLTGISIKELGYSFSVPSDFPNAVSPYFKEKGEYGASLGFTEVDANSARWHHANWKGAGIIGCMQATIYEGRPGKLVLDIGDYPVFYAMSLETRSITNDSYVKLGDQEYSVEKLESYILFQDEDIVVYDVTELVFDFTDYRDFLGRFCDTDLPDVIWIISIRGNIRERYIDFFINN